MDKLNQPASNDNSHENNNELNNNQNYSFGINVLQTKDTCQVHTGVRLDYLCIDSAQNFAFKCMYCVTDDNINQLTLIPIEQILRADWKTVFANYPLKDRDLTKEIKQIAQHPPTGVIIKQQINSFFKIFRTEFMDRIDSIQKQMVEKAQSISDFNDVLMSNYNRVSSKELIRQILVDRLKPIENKSTEIKEICAEVISKDEENTQLFTQLINSMKTLQKATDFETPKLISESILNQLESINMFLVDDIAHLQRQLITSYPKQLPQQLDKQNPALGQIDNLMKIIRNKLNDASSDSCEQLESQLNRYNFIFSELNVPIPGPIFQDLDCFEEEETCVFKELISEVAKLKQARKYEDGNLLQIEGEDGDTSEQENLKSDEIIALISNKTNFCSVEYIEDISKVMKNISGLLGLFRVRKSRCKSVERSAAFNNLSEKQLDDFGKLAAQVNFLTLNHSERYLHSNLPLSKIQLNSTELLKLITKHSFFDGTAEERAKLKMDLDLVFIKYPIFELFPPLSFIKVQPFVFTRTKYMKSSQMGKNVSRNNIEFTFPNCAGKIGQVVSEILSNESGYRLRVKFNRPYGNHGQGHFRIGLIPNSKIDSGFVLQNCYSGLCSNSNWGPEILIRGGHLCSDPLRKQIDEVEMRWCISKQQFFISDTTYTNVNQAKEKYFTPTEIYRFGVCFYQIRESDWKVTITEFSEIDPDEVPRF